MADEPGVPEQTGRETDQRQLELYASDLEKLYWSEKQLRSALAEEKIVLEYKLKELDALNRLFQANLKEERHLRDSHEQLVQRMKQVIEQESGDAAVENIRDLLHQTENPQGPDIRLPGHAGKREGSSGKP